VSAVAQSPSSARVTRAGDVTFPRLLKAEWAKFWSLRSNIITLGVAVAVMLGLSVLLALGLRVVFDSAEGMAGFPTTTVMSLSGIGFAQLAMVVLGVLNLSGEYSTGSVRSTFAADPRRWPTVVAKALVVAAVSLVVMAPTVLVTFLVGNAVLGDYAQSWSDDGIPAALVGHVVVLVGTALMSLGLTGAIRSAAGAISVMAALLLVVPGVSTFLPESWGGPAINQYFFGKTAEALLSTDGSISGVPDPLSQGLSFLVFLVWVVAFLAGGTWLVKSRDV
jgi:ABC-type transport system involved in multi-copper enzyme maturation permease subunit